MSESRLFHLILDRETRITFPKVADIRKILGCGLLGFLKSNPVLRIILEKKDRLKNKQSLSSRVL